MKILCYSTSHDSNFTYYDTEEGKVRYFSIERLNNLKHGECRDSYYLQYARFHFGFDESKDIVIRTLVPDHHGIDSKSELLENELYHFDAPNMIILDHHYCHVLSCLCLDPSLKKGIAIDGAGNFNRSVEIFDNLNDINSTTFRCPKIQTDTGSSMGSMRIGNLFSFLAKTVLKDKFEYRLVNDQIGKLMGLQSYGKLDMNVYNKCREIGIAKVKDLKAYFEELFKDFDIHNQNSNFDLVYTCHQFLVDQIKHIFRSCFTTNEKIAYAGGCALSTVTNSQLLDMGYNLTICPAAADSGLSLGCIKFADMYYNLNIDFSNLVYTSEFTEDWEPTSQEVIDFIAKELSENKIIAYTEGPCEVGPRALGHRSILMNPGIKDGKQFINDKVKHREWWRPFGGTCIDTTPLVNYFPSDLDYYMLRNFKIKPEWKDKLNAIVHVDDTCRMQVLHDPNETIYKIIEKFKEITGTPAVLNTSFNISGKPIADNKKYIFEAFKEIENLDYLIYGGKIYTKSSDNKISEYILEK